MIVTTKALQGIVIVIVVSSSRSQLGPSRRSTMAPWDGLPPEVGRNRSSVIAELVRFRGSCIAPGRHSGSQCVVIGLLMYCTIVQFVTL